MVPTPTLGSRPDHAHFLILGYFKKEKELKVGHFCSRAISLRIVVVPSPKIFPGAMERSISVIGSPVSEILLYRQTQRDPFLYMDN